MSKDDLRHIVRALTGRSVRNEFAKEALTFEDLRRRVVGGVYKSEFAREYGISRETVYRYLCGAG